MIRPYRTVHYRNLAALEEYEYIVEENLTVNEAIIHGVEVWNESAAVDAVAVEVERIMDFGDSGQEFETGTWTKIAATGTVDHESLFVALARSFPASNSDATPKLYHRITVTNPSADTAVLVRFVVEGQYDDVTRATINTFISQAV